MNIELKKYVVEIPITIDEEQTLFQYEFEAIDVNDAYDQAIEFIKENYPDKLCFSDIDKCRIVLSSEVIKTDAETDSLEEINLINGIYPYDPNYSSIQIEDVPFTIFEYLRQLDKDRIVIQPEFQRKQVWKPSQKSKFIESIILNFPLPPIYLNETVENKYIVIDGLQRTSTLRDFFAGKFKLTGLEALPKYNGATFNSLSETIQSKLEDKKLTIFALKPSTPTVVIYDLFNRINTGGTQLNRQEVRNCIYIGKSTRLLKELAESIYFKEATGYGVSGMRMKDREVVLRYIAFRWNDFKTEYTGDMSSFIESMMRRINCMDDVQIQKIRDDFNRVMTVSLKIWDKGNFRIPTKQTRGVINTAVLESVCHYLSSCSDEFIEKNLNIIRSNYTDLINDDNYQYAAMRATANKNSVLDRFRLAHEILSVNTTK